MSNNANVLEDAVCWLDGRSLAGYVKEIELPEIKWATVEHEALGMVGTPEYPVRIEAMECTITWSEFYEELALASADPFKPVRLQFRANMAQYGTEGKIGDRLMKVDLTGRFKENSLGSFKSGEAGEFETMMVCTYVKQHFNGRDILEVDVNIPLYRVNGEDKLANFRKNLGN
ncbi:phage major tail tube protein [Leptolyngbya sp. AN02str]|uniref:phage major tail tube protein n=1 Tax=Leptolyngbya sp. AN02str TaxID=3423363 RepID=UPI003D323228